MRFGGEQVLLGFQDCYVSFLCDLGLGVGGAFFIYFGYEKAGAEGGRRNKIPAVLADALLGWFGLLQLPCVALLGFLVALSRPNTVTFSPISLRKFWL